MKELKTNVLIIGKSGVGKSSLLNYLFGREIQETGNGRPVTKKGIFDFSYQYDNKLTINIYDTWGLEPDKSEEWKKLIMDTVQEHDKKHIQDWFNTIIFCVSAVAERVEEFEQEILKSLTADKNHVVVAVTNCQDATDKRFLSAKKRIMEGTQIKEKQIIPVCSVNKKLIGESVKQFGKESVFDVIIFNLWESMKTKAPQNIYKKLQRNIKEENDKIQKMISHTSFGLSREKKLEAFENDVNEEMRTFVDEIVKDCNQEFSEIIDYYNQLSMKYAQIGLLDGNSILKDSKIVFKPLETMEREIYEKISEIKGNLQGIFEVMTRELDTEVVKDLAVAIKTYISSSREIKHTLSKEINAYMDKVKDCIYSQITEIVKELRKIDYDAIRIKMVE